MNNDAYISGCLRCSTVEPLYCGHLGDTVNISSSKLPLTSLSGSIFGILHLFLLWFM